MKPMPIDGDNYEEDVAIAMVRARAHLKDGLENLDYQLIKGDSVTRRHDFTAHVKDTGETLEIEITRLKDVNESLKLERLRNEAMRIANDDYPEATFFVFIASNCQIWDLPAMYKSAYEGGIKAKFSLEGQKRLNRSKIVRIKKGPNHYHTYNPNPDIPSYRKIVADAIKAKEAKDYLPYRQQDMILVLDDHLIGFDRDHIDWAQPYVAIEHMGSEFSEIYVLSRKSSGSPSKNNAVEFMITPIKAPWSIDLARLIIDTQIGLTSGVTLPMSY